MVSTTAAAASLLPGGFAASAIVGAIKALYGIAVDINNFIDEHIEALKKSPNETIATTGRVLEAAKYGFGLGYAIAVVVIAVGQLLLGNPLDAVVAGVTAATLSNPLAMTCAAVGAIYYGWKALSDAERNAIIERLSAGLELGGELIRSLIDFVIRKTRDFLDSKQVNEFKKYIGEQAARFGRSLFDVTHAIGDLAKGVANAVLEATGQTAGKIKEIAEDAYEGGLVIMKDGADTAWLTSRAVSDAAGQALERTSQAASDAAEAAKRALTGSKPSNEASEGAKSVPPKRPPSQ